MRNKLATVLLMVAAYNFGCAVARLNMLPKLNKSFWDGAIYGRLDYERDLIKDILKRTEPKEES